MEQLKKKVRIVPMTNEYLNDVAELERTCFSNPWSRNMLAEELENACSAFLVALDAENGSVVGYAGLLAVVDEGCITKMAVRPDCRRGGVAGQLLDVFIRFAEGSGLAFLTLEVRESNYAAIALYGSRGFRGEGPPQKLLRPPERGRHHHDEGIRRGRSGGAAMKILAFESSCDETAVAVVEDGRKILSDAIASQADLHALYGGVVPEIASRKHIEAIAALTDQALKEAGVEKKDIDAVAATYAPGLIGAVLVGLNFAKSAAYALNVPLIPVHHIRGHIAANYLAFPELEPPFLALCMSGGNTLIVDVRDYTDFALLGATRDDAAGECFDKAARVLGLPYPGGAAMDKLAHESEGGVYELPRAKIDGCPLDMSFSGLKTAVVNLAHNAEQTGKQLDRAALARDFTQAVVDELIPRAMLAMQQSGRKVLVAAGGVAANSFIRAELEKECRKHSYRLYMPPLKLCGDNGAMIGAQGYYEYLAGARADWALNAYATRDIDDPIV